MRPVRTHTFLGKKYIIDEVSYLGGVTDVIGEGKLGLTFAKAEGIQGLDNALHEALHAIGVPDEYLHDKEGYMRTRDVASFLWRLGWRRKK